MKPFYSIFQKNFLNAILDYSSLHTNVTHDSLGMRLYSIIIGIEVQALICWKTVVQEFFRELLFLV